MKNPFVRVNHEVKETSGHVIITEQKRVLGIKVSDLYIATVKKDDKTN